MKTYSSKSSAQLAHRKIQLAVKAKQAARHAGLLRESARRAKAGMKAARKLYKQARKAARKAEKKAARLAEELEALPTTIPRQTKSRRKVAARRLRTSASPTPAKKKAKPSIHTSKAAAPAVAVITPASAPLVPEIPSTPLDSPG